MLTSILCPIPHIIFGKAFVQRGNGMWGMILTPHISLPFPSRHPSHSPPMTTRLSSTVWPKILPGGTWGIVWGICEGSREGLREGWISRNPFAQRILALKREGWATVHDTHFYLKHTRKSRISCGLDFFFVPLHRNGEIGQDHQHHPGISSTRLARLVHRQRDALNIEHWTLRVDGGDTK